MPATSRDAVSRVLSTAAITGAALILSTAAALPALGDAPSDHGTQHGNSSQHASNQQGSTSDPNGNNGTVFIHQVKGDSHPHNQPHVTCSFYVSFFGFDSAQSLTASFAGQAPTGKDTQLTVNDGTPTQLTSNTPAGGAGNDYDGDLGPFSADNLGVASALGSPAHQGWHIKLTVDTGQGGGHKYKVFWLQPCASAQTSSAAASNAQQATGSTTGGAQVLGSAATKPSTAQNSAAQNAATQSGSATGGAQVLGEKQTRTSPNGAQVLGESQSRAGSLPFTGAEIGLMSAAGLAAMAGGAALTAVARRRRHLAAR